ncbi:MAG TPA: hypothetical protein VFW44_12265 [Bryobacteraceae bacterium]|nr:hypothetical protein [Bryobacteraceae bacterium]
MPGDFEQQLKDALARKEPPAWLEARVLARATAKRSIPGLFRWALATAFAIAIAAGVWTDHRENVQGQVAKARLELALKVTVTELGKIQQTVRTATEEE